MEQQEPSEVNQQAMASAREPVEGPADERDGSDGMPSGPAPQAPTDPAEGAEQ